MRVVHRQAWCAVAVVPWAPLVGQRIHLGFWLHATHGTGGLSLVACRFLRRRAYRMVLRCLLRVAAGAGCALTGVVRGGGSAMGVISWAANSSRVLAACNPRAGGDSPWSRALTTSQCLWEVPVVCRSPESAALGIEDVVGVQNLLALPSRDSAARVLHIEASLRLRLMLPVWCARSTAAGAMPAPPFGEADDGGALGGRCLVTTACRASAGCWANVREMPHQELDMISNGQDCPRSLSDWPCKHIRFPIWTQDRP